MKSDLTRPQSSGGSDGKVSACSAGDPGSIPGSGRRPGEGNGDPVHYSCLENPMDRGAWWAAVHGVAKSWTRLSTFIVQISYLPLTCAPLLWAPHHKANSRRGRLLWERSEHLTLAPLSSQLLPCSALEPGHRAPRPQWSDGLWQSLWGQRPGRGCAVLGQVPVGALGGCFVCKKRLLFGLPGPLGCTDPPPGPAGPGGQLCSPPDPMLLLLSGSAPGT